MNIRDVIAHAAGHWAVLVIGFFATFPLWGHALVCGLRAVLEALNSFGSAG